ncbi:MAG TPA: RraA family protein [Thermoleophilia bacterium]|nr:RraA family protein [Thermoleophilia bacterium]
MSSDKVNKPKAAEFIPGPGFRIKASFERPDAQLMHEFASFDTPDVSDLLNRMSAVSPAIQCLTGEHHKLVGPACTVRVHPADNLMVHKSLDIAQPGDVVVIDAGGTSVNATLGNLVCAKAQHLGIAGFIIDGYVRDLPKIKPLDFPVFARGATTTGPLHHGPGEINYPICCGGVVVNPGDIVVADAAGIVIVPRDHGAGILERLHAFAKRNREYFAACQKGNFSNQWVEDAVKASGCEILP